MLEVGGYESPIELIWGIGLVHWQKDGQVVNRPLLEIRTDLELDDVAEVSSASVRPVAIQRLT